MRVGTRKEAWGKTKYVVYNVKYQSFCQLGHAGSKWGLKNYYINKLHTKTANLCTIYDSVFKLNQQKNHNLNDNNNCNCKLLQKETDLMPILEDIIIWQNSSPLDNYINN